MADMAGRKPGLMIAVGIGKPKNGPPPDDMPMPRGAAHGEEPGEHDKASESEAIVLRANDKTCSQCANYDPADGSCSEVEGAFDPNDRCLRYFEEMGHEDDAEEEARER